MANEKRLIDANALKRKLFLVTLFVPWLRFGKTVITKILESYRSAVFEEIDNAPTVDAVEVVHGRWIEKVGRAKCSVCADECWADSAMEYNYCPNCGAKMDGDGNA